MVCLVILFSFHHDIAIFILLHTIEKSSAKLRLQNVQALQVQIYRLFSGMERKQMTFFGDTGDFEMELENH